MVRATKDLTLPTTITGSLPRPEWYTENLGARPFRDALADARYREQYTDAVGTYIRDQERAGLDIVTDGDARFDHRRRRHELVPVSGAPLQGTRRAATIIARARATAARRRATSSSR